MPWTVKVDGGPRRVSALKKIIFHFLFNRFLTIWNNLGESCCCSSGWQNLFLWGILHWWWLQEEEAYGCSCSANWYYNAILNSNLKYCCLLLCLNLSQLPMGCSENSRPFQFTVLWDPLPEIWTHSYSAEWLGLLNTWLLNALNFIFTKPFHITGIHLGRP